MGLTWDEYLNLVTVITNLWKPIADFKNKDLGIKEKNRRVAAAAINYKEFLNDLKYMQFMEDVRISSTKILLLFSNLKITMIKRKL